MMLLAIIRLRDNEEIRIENVTDYYLGNPLEVVIDRCKFFYPLDFVKEITFKDLSK